MRLILFYYICDLLGLLTRSKSIDFLLTAKGNIKVAQCFLEKSLRKMVCLPHIGTDKALTFPKNIQTMKNEYILPNHSFHETKKSIQQGIESDYFRLKKMKEWMFSVFYTARKTK